MITLETEAVELPCLILSSDNLRLVMLTLRAIDQPLHILHDPDQLP